MRHLESCTYNGTGTEHLGLTLSLLPLTQVMTPQKSDLRKSNRTSTRAWKQGDTRALLRAPGRRTAEEVASEAAWKKATRERKSKVQAMKAKETKTVRDLDDASKLRDVIARAGEEVEDAFPRHRTRMFDCLL